MSKYTEALGVLRGTVSNLKKHYGQSWEWIVDNDASYAEWAANNIEDMDEELRAAILECIA